MLRRLLLVLPLAACAQLGLGPDVRTPDDATVRPKPRPSGEQVVPTSGQSAEAFDTTTSAEREAASAATGGARLGTAVVSLGDPSQTGFWLETPLVTAARQGRIVLPSTGASVQVELRPSAGGGSRLSLPAMRLLGVALTDLPEIEVYG